MALQYGAALLVIASSTASLPSSPGYSDEDDPAATFGDSALGNGSFVTPACFSNPDIPTTESLFNEIMVRPGLIAVVVLAVILVTCTMILFIEGQKFIFNNIPGRRKVHIALIFSLFPVFSVTALCGFLIPKAYIVAKFTSEIWLCLCLFQFVLLVNEYYGSKEKMLSKLDGVKIPLAGPPCLCCCFCCLPSIEINVNNIGRFSKRVKVLVLQAVVLRPILWFIAIILWINGDYNDGNYSLHDAYPYMTLFALLSNFVALQALVTFFKISQGALSSYKIKPKFFTVQFVLIITSVQTLVTSTLAKFGVIGCLGPYNPRVYEKLILNFIVIVEMFFFMMLAAIWYRRVEGNVDDDVIKRQQYKRLSFSKYKKNPAEQIILRDCEGTTDAINVERDTALNDDDREDPIGGTNALATLVDQSETVWRHRGTNGNVRAETGDAEAATKNFNSDKISKETQKEPLILNGEAPSDDKANGSVHFGQPTFMNGFASSKETNV